MKTPHNFDLRSLQVFVVTAEQGGMTQSAKALGMTQSGVSQTIAALEEAVGGRLFDRSVRPIVLTAAGRALLKRGRQILNDTLEAYLEASDASRKQLATLTVAMPESLANLVGPKLFRKQQALSDCWRIWSGLTASHRDAFLSHAVDVIITEDSNITDISGLERHSIFSEPYVLIFPKSYTGSTQLGPHLKSMELVRFSLRSSAGRQTETQLNRLRLHFHETVEFDNSVGQVSAVVDGLGWGITTPLCLLQRPDLIEKLKIAPIKRGGFYRHITLIARENSLGAAAQKLADACRGILRDEVMPDLCRRIPWLEEMLLCRTTREIYKRDF
ncbi:MAG: LysR family transcriptional regulator [Parvularculaceae bacterium]